MINPISAKVDFCNTSLAKCLAFQSQTPKFRPKNHQKKQPGNRYEKNIFWSQSSQKTLRMVPKINKKSLKSKPGPHRVLPCVLQCPRIVPGSSEDRPRIIPGSPRTPKERLQACQMTPMGTKIRQKSIKIKAWT